MSVAIWFGFKAAIWVVLNPASLSADCPRKAAVLIAAMSSGENVARSSVLKALSCVAVNLATCAGVKASDCSEDKPPSWLADIAAICEATRLETSSVDKAVIWSSVRPVIERGAIAFNCDVDRPATASVCSAEIWDDVRAPTCVLDSWLISSSDQELTVELGSARIWAGLSREIDVIAIGLLF
ncbi:MAG: hypothetical protein U5N27_07805 [Rhizobium sp.]|nr:hypothetical protein [Rhizobium sp.]